MNMKFLMSKELQQGKYHVRIALSEFSEDDQKKANKFGMPNLDIMLQDGTVRSIPINRINQIPPYGFNNQKAADGYEIKLKDDISKLKEAWSTLEDKWSKQEVI